MPVSSTKRVYLDHAATSPLDPRVLAAMEPVLAGTFGNANSLHEEGRTAFRALEDARAATARALGTRAASEIVFTSGGTESDNAALEGIVDRARNERAGTHLHVIVSAIEHHAVLEAASHLAALGNEVTYLKPREDGFIHPDDLESTMRADTVLVSVMAANNETGCVQPIDELARIAHAHGARFHADCVQMLGKLPLALEASGVDAASFSGHKVGGPKGVGVLYLRRGTPFAPWMRGGGQESGRRSGTQNVPGIVGMASATTFACDRVVAEGKRLTTLRDRLLAGLLAVSPRVHPVSDPSQTGPLLSDGTSAAGCGVGGVGAHLPNIATIVVDGMESETMLLRLDMAGIAASGGSACSTGSLEPSHVLLAQGIARELAYGEVRFSLGSTTTGEDVDDVLAVFPAIIG